MPYHRLQLCNDVLRLVDASICEVTRETFNAMTTSLTPGRQSLSIPELHRDSRSHRLIVLLVTLIDSSLCRVIDLFCPESRFDNVGR